MGDLKEQILKELETLKEEKAQREASIPPHSIKPHQIQELEALEDRIASLENKLKELED